MEAVGSIRQRVFRNFSLATFVELLQEITIAIVLILAGEGWGLAAFGLVSSVWGARWRSSFGLSIWYLALPLGLGVLALLTLAGGVLGLFYPVFTWVLILPGIAALLVYLYTSGGFGWHLGGHLFANKAVFYVVLANLLISAGALLFIFLTNTLMPPIEWDEIAYHLAVPKIYVTNHRIDYIPFMFQANWPLLAEMLFVHGILSGMEIVAHLLTFTMLIWGWIGTVHVGNRTIGQPYGWIAGSILLTMPLVRRLSGTGMNEPTLIFWGLPAIYCFLLYLRDHATPWLVLAGVFSGFAASAKLTGGGILVLLGICVFVFTLRNREGLTRALKNALWFGLSGLIVFAPWLLRGYAYTGNPIFPFLYSIFGGKHWDALGTEYSQLMWEPDSAVLSKNLLGLVKSVYLMVFNPEALGGYSGGFGTAIPPLILVSFLVVILSKRNRHPLLISAFFGVASYILLWFFFANHVLRYLSPIFSLLSWLAAFAVASLWRWNRNGVYRSLVAILFILLLARDYPWFSRPDREMLASRLPVVYSDGYRRAFLEAHIDVLPVFEYINKNLPLDSTVFLFPYENRGYYLDVDYIWGHPGAQRLIPYEKFPDSTALASYLKSLGVTHILDSSTWLFTEFPDWEHDRKLVSAVEMDFCEPILEGDTYLLCRLDYPE